MVESGSSPRERTHSSLYTKVFVFGWLARMMAIPLLARLIEPGAQARSRYRVKHRCVLKIQRPGIFRLGLKRKSSRLISHFIAAKAKVAIAMVHVRYTLLAHVPQ